MRKCREPTWDNNPDKGPSRVFPIKLIEGSRGHNFCPAKLFRDDPGFVLYVENLFSAWRLGKTPDGKPLNQQPIEWVLDLNCLIRMWERHSEIDARRFNLEITKGNREFNAELASAVMGGTKRKR